MSGVLRFAGLLNRVLHIGAGSGSDLAAYLEAGARSVVLVEADPERAAALERLAADRPEVRVVEAAVSGAPGTRPFHITSFPELNSFRAPAGLKDLFPGLRILSSAKMVATRPAELVRQMEFPTGEAGALLVVEAPGEGLGILQDLAEAGLLERFGHIVVREAARGLYDGAPAAEDLAGWLGSAGYAVAMEAAPEDPERPYLMARFDHSAALTGQLDAARDEIRKLQDELKAARDMSRYRMAQSREELLKAEGQILLLRDLLIDGSGV